MATEEMLHRREKDSELVQLWVLSDPKASLASLMRILEDPRTPEIRAKAREKAEILSAKNAGRKIIEARRRAELEQNSNPQSF